MRWLITAVMFVSAAAFADNVVEFHIKKGTHDGPWNTPETTLVVKVGTTVRLVNDDDEVHILHTFGKPCPHGDDFQPGEHYDCGPITEPFDEARDGELYDHNHGSQARFYLKAE